MFLFVLVLYDAVVLLSGEIKMYVCMYSSRSAKESQLIMVRIMHTQYIRTIPPPKRMRNAAIALISFRMQE